MIDSSDPDGSERTMRFPADIGTLASVRDFATTAARQMGSAVDPAALAVVVGEMAANAAVHQDGEASLSLAALNDGGLRIVVDDSSNALPELTDGRPWDVEGHRGLHLLRALTTEWGAEPTDFGKRVWAVMPPLSTGVPDEPEMGSPCQSLL